MMEYGPQETALSRTALWMSRLPETERTALAATAEVAALVQRTLGGDTTAFEELLVRYERRVFTLSMKLLGSTHDAQDAAQEVFLRVFKYIHRFDTQKPIEPWLMQMTVNVCRNIGRTRQRCWNTFPETVEPDSAVIHPSRDPHGSLASKQQRQLLWKALDPL